VSTSILEFSTSLNGITPTVFNYLSGASSNIQSQLNAIDTTLTDVTYSNNITSFSNTVSTSTLEFSTNLNGITPTVFNYLSGVSDNIQSQFNAIDATLTDVTHSNNITSFSNTVSTSTLEFSTNLNGITPTVFNYSSGASSNIQSQLNAINATLTDQS
jgi:hypothetical protein